MADVDDDAEEGCGACGSCDMCMATEAMSFTRKGPHPNPSTLLSSMTNPPDTKGARAEKRAQALFAQLKNLSYEASRVDRNGNFKGQCAVHIKEEAVGPLVHRQMHQASLDVHIGIGADGYQATRMLTTNKNSSHFGNPNPNLNPNLNLTSNLNSKPNSNPNPRDALLCSKCWFSVCLGEKLFHHCMHHERREGGLPCPRQDGKSDREGQGGRNDLAQGR